MEQWPIAGAPDLSSGDPENRDVDFRSGGE